MRAAKSTNTLAGQQQQHQANNGNGQQGANSAPTSPICRCRVMYLGSSVPHITKDGLQGIQEPLRELYPDKTSLDQGNAGIDSWLSVWSNGILIENVDETGREVKRFFKIEALHYCAAVKYVPQEGESHQTLPSNSDNLPTGTPKFLPLDSPHARMQPNNAHPPIFASILRRTTGVKVLECHAFICKREAAANALVRCCFHAYADTMYAKQIGAEIDNIGTPSNDIGQQGQQVNGVSNRQMGAPTIMARRSKSIAALNEADQETSGEFSDTSSFHNRQQQQKQQQRQYSNSVSRRKSLTNGNYGHLNGGELSDASLSHSIHSNNHHHQTNLQKQQNFSKSMHHLNQPESAYGRFEDYATGAGSQPLHQATSYHNLAASKSHSNSNHHQQNGEPSVPEPFFNPYASRIPSYPPQSIIDQQQTSSGTLRSVKSMAANSIASTLLRSKKHAKAMSMAQLNQSNAQLNQLTADDRITSFHQPQHHLNNPQMATIGPGSFMTLPPVPPMFLPNIQRLPHMNGSQTMKLPGRHNQQHLMHGLGPMPQINFEAMTPKEMKKLLKKSAKYGIDTSRFTDNGLPLMPLRAPVPMPMPVQMPMQVPPNQHHQMSPQMAPSLPNANKSGTLGSQSLYSLDMHAPDMPDYSSQTLAYNAAAGLGLPPPPLPPPDAYQGPMQPIKSILVKPNPEFLKSKAGKKWLKQQKEFKKLLPPHLDGLPIVFGPPPLDALEPADAPAGSGGTMAPLPPPHFLQRPPIGPPTTSMGLPVMDANGYYNPHPFYGPSGRASAASTLLRYSPHSQILHQQQQQQQQLQQMQHLHENGIMMNGTHEQQIDFMQSQRNQSQAMYSDPSQLINQHQQPNGTEPIYSSQLGTFDRQFPFGRVSEGMPMNQAKRNHMVEQSVISLGDENDCEDDDAENLQRENGGGGVDEDDEDDGQNDGYYDRVGSTSSRSTNRQQQQPPPQHKTRRRHQHGGVSDGSETDHQRRQQQEAPTDGDQSNYSSGIYRRKHINERAFSYSIRQEQRSNGGGNTSNSDGDYVTDNGGDYSDSQQNYHQPHSNAAQHQRQVVDQIYQQQQQQNHRVAHQDANNNKHYQSQQRQQTYDSPQNLQQAGIYQNRYAAGSHPAPPLPPPVALDMDMSARLEQQLSMKSFANSGVKSHM